MSLVSMLGAAALPLSPAATPQDDCVTGHQCTILSLALMSLSEREELVESAEDKPFADENCLCDSITEPNFVQCPKGQYEGTEMNPCYGVRRAAATSCLSFRRRLMPDAGDHPLCGKHPDTPSRCLRSVCLLCSSQASDGAINFLSRICLACAFKALKLT